MEEYLKLAQAFQKRLSNQSMPKREARYLMFRMACPLMQAKLSRMIDLRTVPVTWLHGNPHMDNYVKTFHGSAMLDFDRSRMGPYCWDIIRFLSSVSLRREETKGFLDDKVVELFIDAYMTHFLNPEIPAKMLRMLKNVEPVKWQMTTKEYLKSNRRWAKKMRENLMNPKGEVAVTLLSEFLKSRNELNLLDAYRIDEVGSTPGTLGKKHFIYSLMPKNVDSHLDAIILDIKEVYAEKDTKFFFNPCSHHGIRMIEASKIFADGFEDRLGHCTYQNKQYWGRQVPSFAVKVKKYLNKDEQCDFVYSVASQLAKGHRKGLRDPKDAELIEKDLLLNFDKYYKISKFFAFELNLSFNAMMDKIKLIEDYRSW